MTFVVICLSRGLQLQAIHGVGRFLRLFSVYVVYQYLMGAKGSVVVFTFGTLLGSALLFFAIQKPWKGRPLSQNQVPFWKFLPDFRSSCARLVSSRPWVSDTMYSFNVGFCAADCPHADKRRSSGAVSCPVGQRPSSLWSGEVSRSISFIILDLKEKKK